MNSFRLHSVRFEEKDFETNEIRLIYPEHNPNSNYISLIVGNNGTGKSRVLSKIARHFVESFKNQRSKSLFENLMEYERPPEKVIAITNSISDKFPMDESFRPSRNDNDNDNQYFKDFKYNYLGTRSRANSFSNRALMNRALDILFESYSELDVSSNYRHIFDYLDYEPIIKLNYSVSDKIFNLTSGEITPSIFLEYIEKRNNDSRFRRLSPNRVKDLISDKINELCRFLNTYHLGKRELLINFSAKNISRFIEDNSGYESNVNSYNLIGILTKLDIIRRVEIKVYKKGGAEFNFNDASSGEANILSTLIALIPVIKNNSLVLIDEPEISLHPLWQSQYIDLINKIFSNFNGCHIIIASHSHFLVTDLLPEKSAVITLRNKKGQIKSEFIAESTYGWSAEEILYNVFNVKTVRNHFIESDLIDLLGLISEKSQNTSKIRELLQSLKSLSLTPNDPLNAVIEEATSYLKEND
jgi:predicted ATPase